MKIAFLNVYQKSVNRGAETFVYELLSRLCNSHQVYSFEGKSKKQQRTPLLWRVYLDFDGLKILFFTIKTLPGLLKANPDIVIPLNGGWQSAIVRIYCTLFGKKMVIVGQSGIGWDDRNNLWCFPDTFVAISTVAYKWAKKVSLGVPVTYIPNGVDVHRFHQYGPRLSVSIPRPVILCVGALTQSKRIEKTIQAVSLVPNVSLLVVGTGPLKNELVKLGNELLDGRFQLISARYKDMPAIYRTANVFTLVPESSESFGIVYTEALATGLGIVATNDEARKEIIGKAGIYVNPEDIVEYAMGLKKALKTKWSNKPRNQSQLFDWDTISDQYLQLFEKLIMK